MNESYQKLSKLLDDALVENEELKKKNKELLVELNMEKTFHEESKKKINELTKNFLDINSDMKHTLSEYKSSREKCNELIKKLKLEIYPEKKKLDIQIYYIILLKLILITLVI